VCDTFLAAISSFPTVCMDLGGWPVGQAPSITSSQPIMLTDSSVESAPWLFNSAVRGAHVGAES